LKKQKPSYISFGSGLKLLSEEYYLENLKGFVRSRRGFRGLCRAIGCPLVFADQGRAYVDPVTFQICMKAITRAGGRDFLMPGAKNRNGNRTNYPHARASIPIEEIRTHWRWLVGELCAGRRLARIGTPQHVKKAMLDLTTRLAELSYSTLPTVIGEEYSSRVPQARIPEGIDNGQEQQDNEASREAVRPRNSFPAQCAEEGDQ
jgi:hypothetical protein